MSPTDPERTDRFEPLERLLSRAAGQRQRLGDLICASHRLTPQQLAQALAEQQDSGRRLGEILVAHGLVSAAECDVILRFQENQARRPAADGSLSLGALLVSRGRITRQQLDEALCRQQVSGLLIGEELVAAGLVEPSQLAHDLSLQRTLVDSVLLAALALAGAAVPALEGGAPDRRRRPARSRINVAARASFAVEMQFQEQSLSVGAEDLKRGYVDVAAASRFSIRGRPGESYLVEFQPTAKIFDTVFVTGLGPALEVGTEGGSVTPRVAEAMQTQHALGYRFLLRPGTQPGVYPWPLNLFVHPL